MLGGPFMKTGGRGRSVENVTQRVFLLSGDAADIERAGRLIATYDMCVPTHGFL